MRTKIATLDELNKPKYDVAFSWSWEENALGARGAAAADIISQLPAQLGLNLERKKGPVEALAVDRMEKVRRPIERTLFSPWTSEDWLR
jgi:uncharacterized protein (TIGR03435 family)